MPEIGRVEYYNPRKRFGFIRTSDGESLFFTLSNGRMVAEEHNQPVFCELGFNTSERPQYGELVVFERGKYQGSHPGTTEKASPWAYYSAWKHVEQQLADRVARSMFVDPSALESAGEARRAHQDAWGDWLVKS